jgi:hypothetical protein
MMKIRVGLVVLGWLLSGPCVAAEPAAPPTPERFDVKLRYRIDAFPKERLEQYNALLKDFKDIGFDKDEGAENEPIDNKATRMTGSIASANARKILGDAHLKSLLLWPHGEKFPEGDALVRVRLHLADDLNPRGQHLLADQVRSVLVPLGFKEAVGYYSRGGRQLLGMIPASKLESLLEDLRKLPGSEKLEAPFATRSPLLITEVMLGLPPTQERPVVTEPPKGQEKLTPELRALLPADMQPGPSGPMEVLLSHAAARDELHWQQTLRQAAPGLVIEGRLGPLVTVYGPIGDALALAASPAVSTIRLPRSGEPRLLSDGKNDPTDLLKTEDVQRLQAFGRKTKRARLAVVDGDFRGWEALVADKKLPADTRLLDLTMAHNPFLVPDTAPAGDAIGIGSRFAAAVAAAAPSAELTLIRIDPASPYQLQEVARYINGEPVHSENLANRHRELVETRKDLDLRQELLADERLTAYKSIAGEEEEAARKRREAFRKKESTIAQEEKDYRAAMDRFVQLQRELKSLKGIQGIVTPLAWHEGQANDRIGTLSRFFDEDAFRGPLWIFASEDTRGQSWSGLFRDADGNGVMEFAPPDKKLPNDRWTSELNFLTWQPAKGERTVDLPANARFRVSIQWQEAHDAEVTRFDPESYRMPLANLRLVLLRQLDPAGKKQPADDFAVVGQSVGLPQRLESNLNSATYEQTVEFEVKEPGRYALRVEGRVPPGTRPANAPTVPAGDVRWECRPRIFIQTLAGPGRVLFQDFVGE